MTDLRPYKERVVAEKEQLGNRLESLGLFIRNNGDAWKSLPREERHDLIAQYWAMLQYFEILARRIERFQS